MKKRNVNLRILIGLPASGKTSFANKFKKNSCQRVDILGENECQLGYFSKQDVRCEPLSDSELANRLKGCLSYYPHTLIVDGLFLTTERVMSIINCVDEIASLQSVILDYWPENKEACLRNDYLRRRVGSALSIKNLHIDVDFDAIKGKYSNTTVKNHAIYQVPDYVLFFREYGLGDLADERYFCSDTWCVSGNQWDCMGNSYPMSGDEMPTRFTGLDNLLDKIAPNLTASDCRKLCEECVSIKGKEESDYYSRSRNAYYVCDLQGLYDFLSEKRYLNDAVVFSESEKELLEDIRDKESEDLTELESLCLKLSKRLKL